MEKESTASSVHNINFCQLLTLLPSTAVFTSSFEELGNLLYFKLFLFFFE